MPYFNPRTREGCDITSPNGRKRNGKFQSTHPRGVRQVFTQDEVTAIVISIHAPARGATQYNTKEINMYYISIHAPARGATGLIS